MTEEDINKDCASKLSVRFHTDVLKHSLESNYFDKRAEVFVKQLLGNLERLKANTSVWHLKRKKAKEEKDNVNREHYLHAFKEKWRQPLKVQPVVKVHFQTLIVYGNLKFSFLVNESIIILIPSVGLAHNFF